eukprot:g4945.t1
MQIEKMRESVGEAVNKLDELVAHLRGKEEASKTALKNAFTPYDVDKKGRVSRREFMNGVRSVSPDISADTARELCDWASTDDGGADYRKFFRSKEEGVSGGGGLDGRGGKKRWQRKRLSERRLRAGLKKFDGDGDGKLTRRELSSALLHLNIDAEGHSFAEAESDPGMVQCEQVVERLKESQQVSKESPGEVPHRSLRDVAYRAQKRRMAMPVEDLASGDDTVAIDELRGNLDMSRTEADALIAVAPSPRKGHVDRKAVAMALFTADEAACAEEIANADALQEWWRAKPGDNVSVRAPRVDGGDLDADGTPIEMVRGLGGRMQHRRASPHLRRSGVLLPSASPASGSGSRSGSRSASASASASAVYKGLRGVRRTEDERGGKEELRRRRQQRIALAVDEREERKELLIRQNIADTVGKNWHSVRRAFQRRLSRDDTAHASKGNGSIKFHGTRDFGLTLAEAGVLLSSDDTSRLLSMLGRASSEGAISLSFPDFAERLDAVYGGARSSRFAPSPEKVQEKNSSSPQDKPAGLSSSQANRAQSPILAFFGSENDDERTLLSHNVQEAVDRSPKRKPSKRTLLDNFLSPGHDSSSDVPPNVPLHVPADVSEDVPAPVAPQVRTGTARDALVWMAESSCEPILPGGTGRRHFQENSDGTYEGFHEGVSGIARKKDSKIAAGRSTADVRRAIKTHTVKQLPHMRSSILSSPGASSGKQKVRGMRETTMKPSLSIDSKERGRKGSVRVLHLRMKPPDPPPRAFHLFQN